MSFSTPHIHLLKNIDEVIKYCRSINTNDREGVVIQDVNFNRLKVKTDHYRSLFFLKGEDHFSDDRIFASIMRGSIDDALVAWPEIRPRTEEIIAEWVTFRNKVISLCEKAKVFYESCLKEYKDDPKEAKKSYAMFVLEKYKPLSSFLFETIKENADLESFFSKIDYKELKSYWIPVVAGIAV